ncbi:hypothetical protein EJF36_07715 [Bacillus sp. HMF5848]|uniref:hypothetical protein n=1 Tax=Bacillus sp. HMF5848 TaxID=2495421 RepID=UPI000F7685F3|nr:hypothetical protein EJF36_07715 [Bacillus sp. HMF5848]
MEKKLDDIIELLNHLTSKIDTIETRLARLEKVDSIEHRVTVNQIDITDIKDLLLRREELQTDKIESIMGDLREIFVTQMQRVNSRLDSQLLKIARAEEEIIQLAKGE